MASAPMVVTLGLLWWHGNLALLCWLVVIAAVFNWLCAEAVVHARNAAGESAENLNVARLWLKIYNLTTPIYWLFCLAAVTYAIVTKQKP
ncbi:MAG: hypothetical protein NTV93_06080 [Verrucomicrobia bacterium]|nr:hypothetical protein [Verrucomicrobiota bacterium]